ncbi:MAG: response regulator transcription factor [Anaerolineae bacterium]
MSEEIRILAVDDEPGIRTFIKESLESAGYTVATAADGAEALDRIRETRFDLVILDLKLGVRIDGMRVLEALRWRWPDAAALILTAYGSMQSALKAIRVGVDAYLLKPVEPAELRRAVDEALSRRASHGRAESHGHLARGPFDVNLERRLIEREGNELELTPQEFKLLVYFIKNAGRVIPPTELAEVVRHEQPEDLKEARQIVRWHIHRLRQKVEPIPDQPRYILNVRGVGYTLEV